VRGYPRLKTSGHSTLTIDNGKNNSDAFLKLVYLDDPEAHPVRQFFIPAFGSYTLDRISPGKYDLRYMDLGSGALARTDNFYIEETKTENGIEYSAHTIVLEALNGNMEKHELLESEF
jgi:hypothetical protein